ncbi:MAG TPA: hypothetical protein VIU87_12350 [Mycobacterium sp.]
MVDISAIWLKWFISIAISNKSASDTADPRSAASGVVVRCVAAERMSSSWTTTFGELTAAEGVTAMAASAVASAAPSAATVDMVIIATSFLISSTYVGGLDDEFD